jgi:osmoprotectant transport system permease protein
MYDLEWLQPLGFNNSYALMMRKKQAEKLNIRSISDLKGYIEKQKAAGENSPKP